MGFQQQQYCRYSSFQPTKTSRLMTCSLWLKDNHWSLENMFDVTLSTAIKSHLEACIKQDESRNFFYHLIVGQNWSPTKTALCPPCISNLLPFLTPPFFLLLSVFRQSFHCFLEQSIFFLCFCVAHVNIRLETDHLGKPTSPSLFQILLLPLVVWNTVVNVVIPVWLRLPFWDAHV